MTQTIEGLSEQEVIMRRERGQVNTVQFRTGRTYLQILRKNALTFINTILFAIGIMLILLGQIGDALVTAGLVLLNVVVGVYQEGRAKRKLDQIALLARPRAAVIRAGQEKSVDPREIVLGDVLVARPGDQIVVDGQVIGDGRMAVDESLLTGESERIPKRAGDPVYSGSFCVTGSAFYVTQKVGADSLANKLTAGARAFRQIKTPLQQDIDYIIRILVLLVTQLGILLAISFLIEGQPLVEGVRMAAVIVALVPQGLFFMTTVAYAIGALRVAGKGALIQELNAVESASHVNLLCLDKTGTLTTNRIQFGTLRPLGDVPSSDETELRRILGDYAASVVGGTRTTAAIREALGGQARPVHEEVAFDSERKWSALAFGELGPPGVFVLGAPEVLQPQLRPGADLSPTIEAWSGQGLRSVLFAHHPDSTSLHDVQGHPQLPANLIPLALVSLRDELRPEARETLQHFQELGIELKIISGDNPETVAALARQVGFTADIRTISGLEMEHMDGSQLEAVATEATIFGRITPQQKEALIRIFRAKGYYVAMVGDGVNDVLSLKQAQVGIAMQSGSQATRGVADIVLLRDSFAALPIAFREGQRILRGMEDVVRLLLTRTLYLLLLILAIAAWARPGPPLRSGKELWDVVHSTSHFIFPAAFTISLLGLGIYLAYLASTGDVAAARTALTTVAVLCGLVLIPFVEPPTKAWVGGDVLSGDWRPALLALAMLGLYVVVTATPLLRGFFELVLLRGWDYLIISASVAVWALLLRTIWRARLMERLLTREGR